MNLLDKLNDNDNKIVELVKEAAIKQNINVFMIGGVVRDLIMGNKIKDLDFLLEGSAINFVNNSEFKIKSVHEAFNTAKVEINGKEIDIASTREEIYKNQGALPSVLKTGVKIEDDIKRRDFTINSIALNILTNKITDLFCGQNDIKNKTLRVLHKNSFKDDPTRILRGLDFKYRFNFDFSAETDNLIEECRKSPSFENLSIDRIYLTLNKVFSYSYSNLILNEILTRNIYKIWMKRTDLNPSEIKKLDEVKNLFNVEKQSNLYISALESPFFARAPLKDDFEIYEFFKKFNEVQLALYYFKTNDDKAKKYLNLKDIKIFTNGKDLLNLGFKEGKFIGIILNNILKEKILNPKLFNSKEDEIKFILNNYSPD